MEHACARGIWVLRRSALREGVARFIGTTNCRWNYGRSSRTSCKGTFRGNTIRPIYRARDRSVLTNSGASVMVVDILDHKQATQRKLLQVGDGAIIAPDARFIPTEDDGTNSGLIVIGKGARIRSGALICSGVQIGEKSIIGHNVVIRARAKIGANSVISHFVCLERDANIGNNVRISALTHITGNCFIGDNVQVGARVVTINDNEMRWRAGEILQAPTISSGARIGSGTTLLGHVTIGENAFIGAGSVVTRSIPPGTLAYGNPAYVQGDRPQGDWIAGASKMIPKDNEEFSS